VFVSYLKGTQKIHTVSCYVIATFVEKTTAYDERTIPYLKRVVGVEIPYVRRCFLPKDML
jgi:hypothetical protein